ncbi:MAG: UDP-N-acetylmuramoyl-L-alanine--D-glutamate ligase [Patescibacteria group bacterium]|jgi:UDP-N-acetylmuramoylalanine--D-glutamate ligase|nr:UDP-N-acetylmuramoyl-L-alanine--D-glutamate ligase [Patescibacteria group bacterium]
MKNKKIKKIALLGLGLENQSMLKLLDKHNAPVEITICDYRDESKLKDIKVKNISLKYQCGVKFNSDLEKFDILYRSPGWSLSCPGIKKAKKYGTEISSPINFFFETCPSKNIIGITGSKGKGTTATLIYKIIKKHLEEKLEKESKEKNKNVWLGGNIGIAPLTFLEKINSNDFVVLELSSFQLEDLNYSPKYAVITNLFKEHLSPADPKNPNYHSSFTKYFQAKLNIALNKENKYLIVNEKLKNKIEAEKINSKIIYFTKSELESKLSGEYNKENIDAASKLTSLLKINKKTIKKVIKNFKNLEHRLEKVANIEGVRFFDNSFSTTPESTICDLDSFEEKNIIQIAGGADKGADFKSLAKKIKEKTKFLILLPGSGTDKIIKELEKINYPIDKLFLAKNMKEAVKKSIIKSVSGNVVLLSTGCASFGIFKNYKERGDLFKQYVKERAEQ